MKLTIFIISLLVANVSYSDCKEVESIAGEISFKVKKDAFISSVRSMFGDKIIDIGFYSDILSELSVQTLNDQRIERYFADRLRKEFDCSEIAELAEFVHSDLGKKFFEYYLSSLSEGGTMSVEMGLEYVNSFESQVKERNELILSFLRGQKDHYQVDMVEVVVAKDALSTGDKLSSDNLAIRKIPKKYIGTTFVSPRNADVLIGSTLKRKLASGDMVLPEFTK